jgi:hypothetical protein
MPRIDSYTDLDNTTVATNDEFVLWDTSASQVANLPLSALDVRYTPAQSVAMPIYRTSGGYASYPIGGTSGSGSLTNGVLALVPFMSPVANTLDRVGVEVVTTAGGSGSVHRLGLWANSAGLPGTLLTDFGTVATTSTGLFEITISQAVSANTLYWLGVAQQGAPTPVATLRTGGNMGSAMVTTNSAYGPACIQSTGITGALASSPSISGSPSGSVPRIFVRFT